MLPHHAAMRPRMLWRCVWAMMAFVLHATRGLMLCSATALAAAAYMLHIAARPAVMCPPPHTHTRTHARAHARSLAAQAVPAPCSGRGAAQRAGHGGGVPGARKRLEALRQVQVGGGEERQATAAAAVHRAACTCMCVCARVDHIVHEKGGVGGRGKGRWRRECLPLRAW